MAPETIEALFRRFYWDPIAFCNEMFPEKERPREWQPEVIAAIITCPWIAIAACRKAGKTRLAAFIALWFLCTRANSLVLTIAPTWDQVKDGLWADIRHLWAASKLHGIFPSWEPLQTELKTHPLTPKWRAIGLTSDDVQNLEGRHPASGQPALIIFDESKGVPDVFFESIQGMLGEAGVQSRVLAIGTPGRPLGWFYRAFSRERHLWRTFKVRATDIPRLAKRAADRLERIKNPEDPFYRQQELAEFCGADEGVVIPFSRIEKAIGRKFEFSETWRKVASLDAAGEGQDESVLMFRHGPVILRGIAWDGWDEMKSAERVVKEMLRPDKGRPFIPNVFVYDKVGIGAGIGSRIKQLLKGTPIQVVGFRGGDPPRDREQYASLKAEEVFGLRERFITDVPDAYGEPGPHISIPDVPFLIEQLSAWTQDTTARDRTIVVDPDDSPDWADACMMSFAADRLGQSVKGITPSFLR